MSLVIVLFVLATTACSDALPSAASVIESAIEKSEATTSFQMSMKQVVSSNAGDEVVGELTAAIDVANHRMSFSAREKTLGNVEFRVVDGTAYARLPGSDRWMSWPDDEGTDGWDQFSDMATDPMKVFTLLGISSDAIRRDGEEKLNGRTAQRFVVEVPGSAIDDDGGSDEFRNAESVRITAWVGEDGRLVRARIEADVPPTDIDRPEGPNVHFSVELEFSHFGEPVDVQAPPSDQIMDFEDLFKDLKVTPGDAAKAAFAGADCYGTRLAGCLAVNPELGPLASDPAVCQGSESRVCLVPFGNVRLDVVEAIRAFHRETAGIEVVVLPSLPIDPSIIYADTSQVASEDLMSEMTKVYGARNAMPSSFIGITPIDIRPKDGEFAWMFGARYGSGPFGNTHGVFSYFRMANVPPYDGRPLTDDLLHERVAKYAARYTAVLHLHYPVGDDRRYLNYREMYGFSDLDSMGTRWPTGDNPCLEPGPVICLIGDGKYTANGLESDLRLVAKRLSQELGLRVEWRSAGAFVPTQPSWSEEFGNDMRNNVGALFEQPESTLIAVSDDAFARDTSVAPHFDRTWPAERLGVVSVHGAGTPGTAAFQERLYRLVLRAILQVRFGVPLNDDPASIMYRGLSDPASVDGLAIPSTR